MDYNEVVMEGTIKKDPIFFTFNSKERMELKVATVDKYYINPEGEKRSIKVHHTIIVYSQFHIINAKKEGVCKDCQILLRGKLTNAIDSTGEIPGKYCILISTKNHYLKITSNYFLTNKKSKIKNILEDV